jgi:hypothetical protein
VGVRRPRQRLQREAVDRAQGELAGREDDAATVARQREHGSRRPAEVLPNADRDAHAESSHGGVAGIVGR